MANATINRIDTTISAPDQVSIDAGFTQINTAVNNFAKSLTPQERDSLFSAAEENLVFITEANQQAQLLIAQFGPEVQLIATRLTKDLTLGNQVNAIQIGALAQLQLKITDTKRLAFHEAYVGALAIYKFIEAGAEIGLPGFQAAYDVLKVRFANQGGAPANPGP
jgi:hypothetical protein